MTVKSVGERSGSTGSKGLERTTKLLIAALSAAAFMAVLDGAAVSSSLAQLQDSLGGSVSTVIWVTAAYLMAAGTALPLVGWGVDRFGGRRVFLLGIGVFVGGSVLAGLAWSLPSLVVFRVLQGFGGGLLEPASMAIAGAVAPRDQVGKVMGRLSVVINIAPVVGPLFGGLLSDAGLWRAIFLINLPLGAAIVIAALRWLPRTEPDRTGSGPDLLGMLLLAPGFALLLLGLNRWGAGSDPVWVLAPAIAGLVLLAGYLRHALADIPAPVLDLRLLRIPAYSAALAVMSMVGFTMYSQLTVLPIFLESAHRMAGLSRGLLVTALGVGLMISMANSARLSDRVGPRPLVRVGSVLTAAGFAVFVLVHDNWPVPALVGLFVLIGLSFGAVASPTFASVYRAVPASKSAQGTTALFIAVQIFASVGVTVIGLVLARSQGDPFGLLFVILAGAMVVVAVLSMLLPGRPIGAGHQDGAADPTVRA